MLSMNKKRYTALNVARPEARFTLSVPLEGMEPVLREIGKCSGRTVNKFEELAPRLQAIKLDDELDTVEGVMGCIAYMSCRTMRVDDQGGMRGDHYILFATMDKAWVRTSHWKQGKLFKGSPSILTFLGSQTFDTYKEQDTE